MTNQAYLRNLRAPTPEEPLRVLFSACLLGRPVGYDGTANGFYPKTHQLLAYPNLKAIGFCPEHFSFGTPREMCDIHGGTGTDVLNGTAKVLTETGTDWTSGMIAAAEEMVRVAKVNRVELAILMDISAACGSQVIYSGNRFSQNKVYQIGMGVCAANLLKNGIAVISQRDFASLEILHAKLDPSYQHDENQIDHHQTEWYKTYFGATAE